MNDKNFDSVVWRAKQADVNGDVLTPEALKQLADKMLLGSPITFDYQFDKEIGRVVQKHIVGNNLHATVQIDDSVILEGLRDGRFAVRPGFQIEGALPSPLCSCRVIHSISAAHFTVLSSPMPLPGQRFYGGEKE